MSKIDFEKLTDEDALAILKNDFGALTVEHFETQIRSPKDTFWYAEQYAEEYTAEELEQAMKLEGWDKELPERLHKAVVESGLDIYHAIDTHQINQLKCPGCDDELWRFSIDQPGSHTSTHYVNCDYDVIDQNLMEDVGHPEGWFWNADPDENDAHVLCSYCYNNYDRRMTRRNAYRGSVTIHYGDIDKLSAFTTKGSVVRFDFDMHYEDDMIDLSPLPGEDLALPEAVVKDETSEWCDEHDWSKESWEDVRRNIETNVHFWNDNKFRRLFRDVVREWAGSSETHPDINYDYIIDDSSRGTPRVLVPEDTEADIAGHIGHAMKCRE